MKKLEIDLDKIALIDEQKEDENFEFRAFLKGQNKAKIDTIVHRLDKEIRSQIDCQKCGNCCNSLSPSLSEKEIERLSVVLGCSQPDFEKQYIEIDASDGAKCLKGTPCGLLNGTSCTVYTDRPEACKSYPFTQLPNFVNRTLGVISNYGVCPIVFNLYERLKVELAFKS